MGIHFGVRNVKKSLHLVACIFCGDLLEFLLEYLKYSNDSETEGDFMFSVSEASVAVITGGSSGTAERSTVQGLTPHARCATAV